MEEIVAETDIRKYLWLHRLEVSAILYLIINFVSKISVYSNVNLIFYPVLAFYIIYPKYFDSKIPFTKDAYLVIFTISTLVGYWWLGGQGVLRRVSIFNSLGWNWWYILIFVAFNAFFVLLKVFKLPWIRKPFETKSGKEVTDESSQKIPSENVK